VSKPLLEKSFQGLHVEDFLDDASPEDESEGQHAARRRWRQLLELWYEWGQKYSLEAIPDFKEQSRIYLDAEESVSHEIFSRTFGELFSEGAENLAAEKILEVAMEYDQELRLSTGEVLHEWGYMIPFEYYRMFVNAKTFEPEKFDSNKKSQDVKSVPAFAKALYVVPSGSDLDWKSFRDFYQSAVGLGSAEYSKLIDDPDLVVGTSKIFAHLTSFISNNRTEELSEVLQIRKYGRKEWLKARSRLDLPPGIRRPDATKLLATMQKTLLKHKEEAASLLKTHMYLTDLAYKTGGDNPTFVVEMDKLLETKGYTRRENGTFQASTLREEWSRIVTLSGCWLEINKVVANDNKGILVDETPYWEVRARRRVREGEQVGLESVLLEDPSSPVIRQALIQPGLWWAISERGTMNFHLPYQVLALPTDGKGNETNRVAVQIAATLALWVRSSQLRHAGKFLLYSVGKLLEVSGIKTKKEFEQESNQKAKRLRKYLAGTPDDSYSAIKHLTDLGAFDITIADEEEFWASGKGWQERFWNAKLKVKIPNLAIKKSKRKYSSRIK